MIDYHSVASENYFLWHINNLPVKGGLHESSIADEEDTIKWTPFMIFLCLSILQHHLHPQGVFIILGG